MPWSSTNSVPTYVLTFTHDGRVRQASDGQEFERENHYYLGDRQIAQALGAVLPADLADIVDIATAVYTADRLSRRRISRRESDRPDYYHLKWTRRFEIRLPVRNPARWRDTKLAAQLSEVLWFFTEDEWNFDFVPKLPEQQAIAIQSRLFPVRPPVTVALFSGGLDSLAGLCRELAERDHDSFVLVSGRTGLRIGAIQRNLARNVERVFNREILHVLVPLGLVQHGKCVTDYLEDAPRSRGFTFMAIGAVVAMMVGSQELAIYENGIAALNLPYTSAQLGTHGTRSADPRGLIKMSELISAATQRPFVFCNPFLFKTKAELCTVLTEMKLGNWVSQTNSCDSFPQRVAGFPQCGLCTSCVLRRQALNVAGLGDFDNLGQFRYRHDILASRLNVSERKLYPFRAMLDQVSRIRAAINSGESWRSLIRLYPQLAEVAWVLATPEQSSPSIENRLVGLYDRYCDEWDRFSALLPALSARQVV